jgi:hypothetical protein
MVKKCPNIHQPASILAKKWLIKLTFVWEVLVLSPFFEKQAQNRMGIKKGSNCVTAISTK